LSAYIQSFGDMRDPRSFAQSESHCRLAIDAAQLAAHWHRCGMTADFWARYGSLFIPAVPPRGFLSRESAFHVFTYLLNEMFENCAKFSRGPVGGIGFDAWLMPDDLVYQISNHITPAGVQGFAELIQELLTGDIEELYFRKLEANAESGTGGSGLGYLTLMKDYGIRFGFGFATAGPGSIRVDVQAVVSKKEI
jgi:hypothetical protein